MLHAGLNALVQGASATLCDILDPGRGTLEPPIRAEIFGPQRFAEHGRSLAGTHRADTTGPKTSAFFPRLLSNIRTLREAQRYIGAHAATGYDISPAGEWLLDNFHLIEAQLKAIHDGLPRSYFRALPVLADAPLAGLPRVYGIAWAFVAHTDGAFDEELLIHFLGAYQGARELNLSEMWALPTTLRVVLIENLRRLAERVATNKAAREAANLCCDQIETYTLHALDQLLELLHQRGVGQVFLTQMAQRLQDRRVTGEGGHQARYLAWLRLAQPDMAATQAQQNADQAADNLSVSNAVTSLRLIGDADWPNIVERTSGLMALMLTCPVFAAEHVSTRDQTLHGIELLARRSRRSEVTVAATLLDLMRSGERAQATDLASHWLEGEGRPALARALGLHEPLSLAWRFLAQHLALPTYLGALVLGTVLLLAWLRQHHGAGGGEAPTWLVRLGWFLMAVPASEAVVAVVNRLVSESVRPRHLPRLSLAMGIPPEHRVLVVVPAMLTSLAANRALVHRLHLHRLANPEAHAQFALLTDWADADTPHTPEDAGLLDDVVRQVGLLNLELTRPGGLDSPPPEGTPTNNCALPLLVLHRQRQFCTTEQRWIGWERKRGKLQQLVDALAEGHSGAFMDLGEVSRLASGVPYIVTLDSDTQLPPGRLRDLVGVAAHPANQPRFDATGHQVVGGYGILQPSTVTPLPAQEETTHFHALFAGQCGMDPYSAVSSEIYQDVFGEGSFSGKGLLNVQAMQACLAGRLPEGLVLSHDLLEGAMARCAVVSDMAVIEQAPFHADVAASRAHRWTRGDWQLLPFLVRARHYGLKPINVWKMVDNLRRSLVAPACVALLAMVMAGLVISPAAALVLVVAAYAAGPALGAMAGFLSARTDLAQRHFYREASIQLLRVMVGAAWQFGQLLAQALLALDAIGRALYRMGVSHRHLLQWTTTATAQALVQTNLWAVARQHWVTSAVAAVLGLGALAARPEHWPVALALCLVWGLSPVWVWWASRPRLARLTDTVSEQDTLYLHGIARDTWRYFERCVGADDSYLPPDNLQTSPHDMVAHRTSPTNIGLYLLCVACARQFGWIGTQDLLARLEATLATLATLERHRGHFLNWYDTRSGMPLLPMYVSTVDSGNLSGHLVAVAQACRELALAPYDRQAAQRAVQGSQKRLTPLLLMRSALPQGMRDALTSLLADHRTTQRSAALDTQACAAGPGQADATAHASQRLLAVANTCERLAWQPDFAFLYHRKRHLLHLGYRVAEQQLDTGFYDLLASEARLTGLLAIAKGDVPVNLWRALGRPFYALGSHVGLRSWSGSMFEYLMPGLVMAEPHGSALGSACEAALQEQMDFANAQGLPWGISESAYAGQDHTLAYQYAPHGVPRLALRRTPPNELVIAPYATALAAQVSPRLAVLNFIRLQKLGARARYGFIEALDFSPAQLTGGGPFVPVVTFMAHHQGMSIVALANVLLGGVAQRWGMANAHVEAVTSLLHERCPREVSTLFEPPGGPPLHLLQTRYPGLLRHVVPGLSAIEPTQLLSNGRYHVSLRANGAGWSRLGQVGINRWRDDALRDQRGSFIYVRRLAAASPVSLTQHPAPDPAAHYQCSFYADRVSFDTTWTDLKAQTTVWVSPEDDVEFRQVELCNASDRPMALDLISAFDVALSHPDADEAHPAFTNLFVEAQWQAHQQALIMTRRPRLATERGGSVAHFVAGVQGQVDSVAWQTDRQRWLGRNHDVSQPLASFEQGPSPLQDDAGGTGQAQNTGLDPVCALQVRLHIPPYAKATVTFATAASDDRATLLAIVDKCRQASHIQRASLMSSTLTNIRLHALRISPENFAAYQSLTTALVLRLSQPGVGAAPPEVQTPGVCDRRLLWRLGISGDRPIILVTTGLMHGLGLLRSLTQTLRLWSWVGVSCDLVVVNAEAPSYDMPLHRELTALRDVYLSQSRPAAATERESETGYHVLHADAFSADELSTLQVMARVRLHADGRPLQHHVLEWLDMHDRAFTARCEVSVATVALARPGGPEVTAPQGDFLPKTGEFQFLAGAHLRPLRPWINVLSNPQFGAQISEAGGGYTWAINSRTMQLTGWSNDPVADLPAEWFLLQDSQTQEVWSVSPSAWGAPGITYRITHGQGSTVISHRHGDLSVSVNWCVDAATSVKQVRISLVNHSQVSRRWRVIGMLEWIMGERRSDRSTVVTALHRQRLPQHKLTALLCTQRERASGFGDGTAFLSMALPPDETEDWTCDRREFFDARGQLVVPDHLSRRCGSGTDPCAALSTRVALAAGEAAERVFLVGYANSPAEARELAVQSATTPARQRQTEVAAWWNGLLGAVSVTTPDPLFDAMVNRWLLYQTVTCRLWAKAGFYQAGGATGFRDQLQDAMSLAWVAPGMLRQQVLVAASRQFPQGDVQHWWHAPSGAGVRTHFSDDLLWLPYACAHYVRATGDATLLDEQVAYIEGAAIAEGAEDAYYTPHISPERGTVYEHAARAIDHSLRVGAHGLPLMGSGDWNDGMNRVASGGRGESVWLGWFLCSVVEQMLPLALQRGDEVRAQRWAHSAQGWRAALGSAAWDGRWFKRAFFDNGQALGSQANAEAQIDMIAQAWSVISGATSPSMQRMAMASAAAHLVDDASGLIKLLDPPLVHTEPTAGYIQAYPPGVRENGGQYTHAGVWALMARAQLAVGPAALGVGTDADGDSDADAVYRYFTYLCPAHRAAHPSRGPVYGLEPYAVAGDVYSQPPYVGRGGWSWYTGAAAWLHRAAVESIFGLRQVGSEMHFTPCLPAHWPRADLRLRRDDRALHFILIRPEGLSELAQSEPEWFAAGASLLQPGQVLNWQSAGQGTTWVIPLPAKAA